MSTTAGGGASVGGPVRSYRLVSATYLDKTYPDGVLRVNETGTEMELTQWTGKKKKEETVVARFRLEFNAEVLVGGPLLKVSGLSITLESPAIAAEVADILRRPSRERESVRVLIEDEASVGEFLEAREEALSLLARMKVDPRAALLSVGSLWTDEGREPLDAVHSAYSTRISESLDGMTSSLAGNEETLGSSFTERLFALAYTIGVVQDALFVGNSDLAPELAALQELGIATTAEDLRMEKPTGRLMQRAHQVLVAEATANPSSN